MIILDLGCFQILEEVMATHWKLGKVFIVATIRAK